MDIVDVEMLVARVAEVVDAADVEVIDDRVEEVDAGDVKAVNAKEDVVEEIILDADVDVRDEEEVCVVVV